ncbi:MAG: HD domain-containing protein [Lachnospiraceae bacterium]|nr:HD domain-containing protein [Lachnospiraceae bacterium]
MHHGRNKRGAGLRALAVLIGIFINVLFSFLAKTFGWIVYPEVLGTMLVAAIGGIFPGVTTAVFSGTICMFLDSEALYYIFIDAVFALAIAAFVKSGKSRVRDYASFILASALIRGGLYGIVQWGILGGGADFRIIETVENMYEVTHISRFSLCIFINILLSFVNILFSLALSALILRFIPKEFGEQILNSGWQQKPLSKSEVKKINFWGKDVAHSVRSRITFLIVTISLALVFIMACIGINLFLQSSEADNVTQSWDMAKFAAANINADKVDMYLDRGSATNGYDDTKRLLGGVRASNSHIKRLYVARFTEEGAFVAFDLTEDEETALAPGDEMQLTGDWSYLFDLYAGKEVGPIKDRTNDHWTITVFEPVLTKSGECVCHVAVVASLDYITTNIRNIAFRMALSLTGFLFLILVIAMWVTGYYTVYPINSIAECIDGFVDAKDDQAKLDENVRKLRKLDVRTEDEVEKMYQAISDMAASMAEQMRDIRHYADTTAQMQNGLLVTMADLVESRDSDTGAHIQKTAAYVRIVLNGLQQKGYYAEKLTPKYMYDVEMSAPLHDVGKINIPDAVLNKPGKLTDEEFAIMKTHTTVGKIIMERAISTVQGDSYLKEARNMAAYHHERWDGKGYPEGLHGEVIPLSARIMAVADVFDALSSPRVYKPAFPLEKALEIIQEGSGTQFDPKCVEVFMESLDEVKEVLKKYNQL